MLVTGASRGIGQATALAVARAGAKVALVSRGHDTGEQARQQVEAVGAEAIHVAADVREPSAVASMVAQVVERWGRLDAAVNNAAGGLGMGKPVADFSEEEFDAAITDGLRSVWLGMRAQIRQMTAQQPTGGSIVNVSSVNGLGGVPTAALYAAAKAGVLALTKSAAMEYVTAGLRINAVVPGAFRTPMLEGAMERAAGSPERVPEVEAQYRSHIPAGRIGDPDEVASLIAWLCSPASSYCVGGSFVVDGGVTAHAR